MLVAIEMSSFNPHIIISPLGGLVIIAGLSYTSADMSISFLFFSFLCFIGHADVSVVLFCLWVSSRSYYLSFYHSQVLTSVLSV